MLENITYFQILGKPLTMYIGIITLVLLIIAAITAYLGKRGEISLKWHTRFGISSLVGALIHGILSMLTYF
ncbi:hypothetical protein KA107_01800 [Candidatus Pacearchaeota archaeon]|nr:hypothetical protein [Candidatus Pacearchaeota archaeon]